jgi:outer membrane protein OmpA-like peptidoglycan-associated protein
MKTWWEEPEPEYVPITKMIPQITYETVIEHEFIYKEIFVQLPPEVIHDTIIQEITREVPVYIYETIIEKVPEYIYETITNTEYITIHDTITEVVHDYILRDPTEAEIKDYIKEHTTEIIEIIKDDSDFEEIIKEIIKKIPPNEIVTYLTDEQVKYIIQQQPPQVILQTIQIIDIEYIIFAGSADKYNGPHGAGASTDLTAQEKKSNDASVSDIAKALKDNPDYLIMLHGHANPTSFTEGEIGDLMTLSLNRAKAVEAELRTQFKKIDTGVDIDDSRISVSGYGGGKNLFGSNSTYAGLNRRVEMILIRVGV